VVDDLSGAAPDPNSPSFSRREVLYWNGIPIQAAIEINGETQAGM